MNEFPSQKNKASISLDARFLAALCILLLVVIGVMLFVWKPWNASGSATDRKITISGEATIKAEPDEYVFNPSWEKPTQEEITKLNDETVAKLKELGVADSAIKNNATAYNDYYRTSMPAPDDGTKELVRQLMLTITVDNKELAQKVQDYLLTTGPQGSITPYPQFSTAKQKELEDRARTDAIADAKQRAETTASGLDAKVGKVLEVNENQGGGYYPMFDTKAAAPAAADGAEGRSLSIQPGENEFSYTVEVVFALQ